MNLSDRCRLSPAFGDALKNTRHALLAEDPERSLIRALTQFHDAARAETLRDAEEICDEAGAVYTSQALNEQATGAYELMERFRRKAEEAEQTAVEAHGTGTQQPTRCTCDHARAMHTGPNLFCAVPGCECPQYAGAQQQPDIEAPSLPDRLQAALTERFTALGNPFSEMRRHEKGPDGWPATHPVSPAKVAEVLRELLADAPAPVAQQPAAEAPSGCPHRGPHPGFTCAEVDQTRPFWDGRWDETPAEQQAAAADGEETPA